jgi:hypothetical protein
MTQKPAFATLTHTSKDQDPGRIGAEEVTIALLLMFTPNKDILQHDKLPPAPSVKGECLKRALSPRDLTLIWSVRIALLPEQGQHLWSDTCKKHQEIA